MIRLLLTLLSALGLNATIALAQPPEQPLDYLTELDGIGYLEAVADSPSRGEGQYLIPLGAIQKIRGVWAPRDQERVQGDRVAHTWRVIDGFTSAEVFAELESRLGDDERVTTLFSCDGRACGASVQWANRVFRQRLLYGREDSQSYRAMAIDGEQPYRLLLYASARSTDRQYLHAELIELEAGAQSGAQ